MIKKKEINIIKKFRKTLGGRIEFFFDEEVKEILVDYAEHIES